jgi:hypothetical protein
MHTETLCNLLVLKLFGHLGTKSLILPITEPAARQPHIITLHICQSMFQGTHLEMYGNECFHKAEEVR